MESEESERLITLQRRLKLTQRTCVMCARNFLGWGVQRFCKPACQRRWDYHKNADKRRATRRAYYRRQRERGR
jgi:hypothetical protein